MCYFGNGLTKSLKIDTATPQAGTQLYLMDGTTKARPTLIASLGTQYNIHGIKWIRFSSIPTFPDLANKIWDVNPALGIITGESTTYNCN